MQNSSLHTLCFLVTFEGESARGTERRILRPYSPTEINIFFDDLQWSVKQPEIVGYDSYIVLFRSAAVRLTYMRHVLLRSLFDRRVGHE